MERKGRTAKEGGIETRQKEKEKSLWYEMSIDKREKSDVSKREGEI